MLRLYDYLPSGNGYKVRLLLTQLGRAFERVEVDIVAGETRTAAFLQQVNPNGRIPAIAIAPGRVLWESNAILHYCSEGTDLLPTAAWARAQVQQWMCFEQYSHEPNIATVRFWLELDEPAGDPQQIARKRANGYAALAVMEQHLRGREFFVENRYSIADIALYAYTHVADEGGFDLSAYPQICTWLERVRSQPHHVEITAALPEWGNRPFAAIADPSAAP